MIKQVTVRNAHANGALLDEMYRARGRLFGERLGWPVSVDEKGRERDRFDGLSPHYLIAVDADGHHRGSLRLLPTTGEVMLRDQFTAAFDGTTLESAMIWECTRFCVEGEGQAVAATTAKLLLGLCEFGLETGLTQIAGIFDGRAVEFYREAGWSPEVIARNGRGKRTVFLALWDVDEVHAEKLRARAGITGAILENGASGAWDGRPGP